MRSHLFRTGCQWCSTGSCSSTPPTSPTAALAAGSFLRPARAVSTRSSVEKEVLRVHVTLSSSPGGGLRWALPEGQQVSSQATSLKVKLKQVNELHCQSYQSKQVALAESNLFSPRQS